MKNQMLNVTAIILIVLACILFATGLLFMAVQNILMDIIYQAISESGVDFTSEELQIIELVVPVLGWVLMPAGGWLLFMGIVGVRQKRPVLAIVLASICLAGVVTSLSNFNFFTLVDIALYVLYLIGAIQLNKQRKAEELQRQSSTYTEDCSSNSDSPFGDNF